MTFGFRFCSVLGKTWVRVRFVVAGFGFFPISSWNVSKLVLVSDDGTITVTRCGRPAVDWTERVSLSSFAMQCNASVSRRRRQLPMYVVRTYTRHQHTPRYCAAVNHTAVAVLASSCPNLLTACVARRFSLSLSLSLWLARVLAECRRRRGVCSRARGPGGVWLSRTVAWQQARSRWRRAGTIIIRESKRRATPPPQLGCCCCVLARRAAAACVARDDPSTSRGDRPPPRRGCCCPTSSSLRRPQHHPVPSVRGGGWEARPEPGRSACCGANFGPKVRSGGGAARAAWLPPPAGQLQSTAASQAVRRRHSTVCVVGCVGQRRTAASERHACTGPSRAEQRTPPTAEAGAEAETQRLRQRTVLDSRAASPKVNLPW